MNGKQDWMANHVDKRREARQTKAARSARAMTIRMEARKLIAAALKDFEDPAEGAAFLGDVLDITAEELHPRIGRVSAATAFNSRAADICATFRLHVAVGRAAADQAFDKLTRHANDGGQE